MRRLLLGTLAAGVVALLLGVAATLALLHGWQRERVTRLVEAELASALGVPVHIGALEGALQSEPVLRGLVIGREEDLLLEVRALRVRVAGLHLAPVPTLELAVVELEAPHATLRGEPAQAWPWRAEEPAGRETPETEGTSWALRVDALRIADAVLDWERPGGNALHLRGALRTGALRLGRGLAVEDASLQLEAEAGGVTAHAEARGGFDGARWQLAELRVEGAGARADVSGRGDLDAVEHASLVVEAPDLSELGRLAAGDASGLAGSLHVRAELAGPFRQPLRSLAVTGTGLAFAGTKVGDLALEATSPEADVLEVPTLRLRGGAAPVEAEPGAVLARQAGGLALRGLKLREIGGAGTLALDASLSEAGLAAVRAGGWPGAGNTLRLQASGWRLGRLPTLPELLGVSLTGALAADLHLRGAAGGPDVEGTLHLADGSLGLDPVQAAGVDVRLDLHGSLGAPAGSVRARASSLAVGGRALGQLDLAAQGAADGGFAIEQLDLREGPLPLRLAPGARLRLSEGGVALEHATLESAGDRITLAGRLGPQGAEGIRLGIVSLDLGRAFARARELGLVAEEAPVAGRIQGELRWDGPVDAPRLAGELHWSDAVAGGLSFDRIEATVRSEAGATHVASTWWRQDRALLDVDASLPSDKLLAAPGSLAADPQSTLTARADGFDLAALAPFLPKDAPRITGTLDAELRARGAARGPELAGQLALADGAATLAVFGGQRFAPITARASLAGERLQLQELRVGEPGAGLHGEGELRLEGLRPAAYALSLDFDAFPLEVPRLVQGKIDGSLALGGSPELPELRGDLELSKLALRIPEPEAAEAKEIRVLTGDEKPGTLREGETQTSLLDPFRVDVKLRIARGSWARGRGAEVELAGALRAEKEPREPLRLSGAVETVRGTYAIYGRRFRIEKGSATLDGSPDVDPVLDVRAEHRVADVRIDAILTGRLSDPTLHFESQPPLSETDIASYLLVGRPASEVGPGGQAALGKAAAAMAAGMAVQELEQIFGGSLPVDLVDVKVDENGGSSDLGVGVGKYVGDRLFLYYEHRFEEQAVDDLHAEYELTPHWSVESSVSSEGAAGGDLIFQWDY